MYDAILIPTDGSEVSLRAAEHGLDIATTFGATVHVVYVVDARAYQSFDVPTGMIVGSLEREGRGAIESVTERARAASVDVVDAIRKGPPPKAICDYAAENDVDLIVMGTHGRTGVDRFLLGSVTEGVIREADAPVLTVRERGPDASAASSAPSDA